MYHIVALIFETSFNAKGNRFLFQPSDNKPEIGLRKPSDNGGREVFYYIDEVRLNFMMFSA